MSIGIVGGVVGIATGIFGAVSSAKAAKNAGKAAAEASKAELDFEKEKYQEWKDTYGDLEDNLSSYYKGLTPTLRTMQGLEKFEKEKNIALTGLRENLAQRGIATSGIAAQTETAVALDSASARAKIRADAPMQVASEQAAFLQVGLGQDPSGGVSGALSGSATRTANVAATTAAAAGTSVASAIGTGFSVAEELYGVFNERKEAKTTTLTTSGSRG